MKSLFGPLLGPLKTCSALLAGRSSAPFLPLLLPLPWPCVSRWASAAFAGRCCSILYPWPLLPRPFWQHCLDVLVLPPGGPLCFIGRLLFIILLGRPIIPIVGLSLLVVAPLNQHSTIARGEVLGVLLQVVVEGTLPREGPSLLAAAVSAYPRRFRLFGCRAHLQNHPAPDDVQGTRRQGAFLHQPRSRSFPPVIRIHTPALALVSRRAPGRSPLERHVLVPVGVLFLGRVVPSPSASAEGIVQGHP